MKVVIGSALAVAILMVAAFIAYVMLGSAPAPPEPANAVVDSPTHRSTAPPPDPFAGVPIETSRRPAVTPGASSSAPARPPRYAPARPGSSSALLIPVAGVGPGDLVDTFSDARSGGRVHDAIDIHAPRGTPVLATADGTLVKLFNSEMGGLAIYQLDPDQRTIYYYAHLDRYATGVREGMWLRQGDIIGYVGDTGNARVGNYHLHFEISTTPDPKRYWGGTPINPYPWLVGGGSR